MIHNDTDFQCIVDCTINQLGLAFSRHCKSIEDLDAIDCLTEHQKAEYSYHVNSMRDIAFFLEPSFEYMISSAPERGLEMIEQVNDVIMCCKSILDEERLEKND